MSEKVILPRDVAEALTEYLERYGAETFITDYLNPKHFWTSEFSPLCGLEEFGTMEVISALVNGYEVEKSPEEKVREYYDSIKELHCKYELDSDDFVIIGIKRTLELLGITIEGINGAND